MTSRPRPLIARLALSVAALAGALSTTALGTSGAQFSAMTSNVENHVQAIEVLPPQNLTGSLSFTLLLNCRAELDWDPSPTPGVDEYEVRRVRVSDNATLRTVVTNQTEFVEIVGAALLGQTMRWEIRSIHGDFYSAPATVTTSAAVLCLLS